MTKSGIKQSKAKDNRKGKTVVDEVVDSIYSIPDTLINEIIERTSISRDRALHEVIEELNALLKKRKGARNQARECTHKESGVKFTGVVREERNGNFIIRDFDASQVSEEIDPELFKEFESRRMYIGSKNGDISLRAAGDYLEEAIANTGREKKSRR